MSTAHLDPDRHVRDAAFKAIDKLLQDCGGTIPWKKIAAGFQVGSETVLFATRARGIFKPQRMSAALSIKTSVPKSGIGQYRDQGSNAALRGSTDMLRYDLAHGGENNRFLREAWTRRVPLIYLRGVAPAMYEPVRVWIEEFQSTKGYVLLSRNPPRT